MKFVELLSKVSIKNGYDATSQFHVMVMTQIARNTK